MSSEKKQSHPIGVEEKILTKPYCDITTLMATKIRELTTQKWQDFRRNAGIPVVTTVYCREVLEMPHILRES
jgi:hypothetical protein